MAAQPRTKEFDDRLQKSAKKGVSAALVKLKKDLQQYENVKVEGKYVTSNRLAESVIGHFKKLEESSSAASIEKIADQTISRMNRTENFLLNMNQQEQDDLWRQITAKLSLKS